MRRFSACLIALMLCARVSASDLDVYVLAGQSNMSGWGDSSTLTGELAVPQNDVLYHVQGGGFGFLRPTETDYGPELSFGRTVGDAYPDMIGIVKSALGSTSLAVNWNPEQEVGLYRTTLTRVATAREYWAHEGYTMRIAGIVWMQGEQDAKFEDMARDYASNLVSFIEHIRADLDVPDAPFIFGQIRGKDYPYREVVRDAQFFVDSLGIGAYLVETDDLSTYEELHFDSAGQITLGRRLGTALLGTRSSVAGDVNGDGAVNLVDLNAVRNNFDGWGLGDVTRDGRIDLNDLNIVRENFGGTTAVPEPASYFLTVLLVALLYGFQRSRQNADPFARLY